MSVAKLLEPVGKLGEVLPLQLQHRVVERIVGHVPAPEAFEREPRAGHERGRGAPVAAHLGALARGEDRAPVVHHADDRHARPRRAPRPRPRPPRSRGRPAPVAQSTQGQARGVGPPERRGEQGKGIRRARAAPPRTSARATSWVRSWSTARPDSISTRVDVTGTLTRVELAAQPLERLAVVGGDPGDERRRRLGPIALGPAAVHPGRTLGDQPFERAVGVGARQARPTGRCA